MYISKKMQMLLVAVVLSGLMTLPVFAFEFRGFSDVTYTQAADTPKDEDCAVKPGCEFKNGSFGLGAMDLYLAQNISDRLNALVELVVETPGKETVVDLERLEVGYSFNDALNIRAGRFHNLLGYWNLNFHHGTHLQDSIGRPEFLNFEDDSGIVPVHVVGLWLRGRYKTTPLRLEYGVMVGNGISVSRSDAETKEIVLNVAGDNNKNKSLSFQVRFFPAVREELSLNLFGHIENDVEWTDAVAAATGKIDQRILGVDLAYDTGITTLLAEYYNFSHKDQRPGKDTLSSNAFYLHGSYKVVDLIRPYLRYENLKVKENDPYFDTLGVGSNQRYIYGLRYDLGIASAIKLEGRMISPDKGDKFQEYAVQWSFAF